MLPINGIRCLTGFKKHHIAFMIDILKYQYIHEDR